MARQIAHRSLLLAHAPHFADQLGQIGEGSGCRDSGVSPAGEE